MGSDVALPSFAGELYDVDMGGLGQDKRPNCYYGAAEVDGTRKVFVCMVGHLFQNRDIQFHSRCTIFIRDA